MFAKKGGGSDEKMGVGSVEIETREDSTQAEQRQEEAQEEAQKTMGDTEMVDELTVDENMQAEIDAKKGDMVYTDQSRPPGFTQPKPDYGLFTGARISGDDEGGAKVVVPLKRGRFTLEVDAELAASWITDNLAGSVLAETKKHKP